VGMKLHPDMERKVLELAGHLPEQKTTPTRPRTEHQVRLQLVIQIAGLKLASEANIGGKLGAKIKRKSALKDAVRAALPDIPFPITVPVPVVFTRIGVRKLDDDNLQHAFKPVRDVVAEWLGVDDGDTELVRFSYKQRPGYSAGVEIKVG